MSSSHNYVPTYTLLVPIKATNIIFLGLENSTLIMLINTINHYSCLFVSFFLQVLVTNLDVESVTHLEPANFWIGPSAVSHILFSRSVVRVVEFHSDAG